MNSPVSYENVVVVEIKKSTLLETFGVVAHISKQRENE